MVLHHLLSGRSAVWLAHLNGVQGVGGSNPLVPTNYAMKTAALVSHERLFFICYKNTTIE
jgi:hypothetical protein